MKFFDFPIISAQKEAGDPMFGGDYKGLLTDRERYLLGIAVAATRGCPECTGKRIEAAKKANIDENVLIEAINLCAAINAGHTVTMAINGTRDIVRQSKADTAPKQ